MTISFDERYHLFKEAFSDETVYLQLSDCKELSIKDNYYGSQHERQITIGIPAEIWEHIINNS
jgi:hypothetical protein